MTKEQAIELLKADIKHWENTSVSTDHLTMAIKALEQQPTEDCVSREQAVKAMTDWYIDMLENGEGKDFINILDALPPVTPTRKVGKWIYDSGSYKCPFCEHEMTGLEKDLNYCCKCGADMINTERGEE